MEGKAEEREAKQQPRETQEGDDVEAPGASAFSGAASYGAAEFLLLSLFRYLDQWSRSHSG
ncbi:MAG: hypothetical protein AUF60_04985 [Gemmatimonadetes bacterium 13_1_20CM_69_28]|nr:MAG: hypothetical protein AUF60_04985 [Gemmatimonadetes bacterium 13_1_20CM_69_28]